MKGEAEGCSSPRSTRAVVEGSCTAPFPTGICLERQTLSQGRLPSPITAEPHSGPTVRTATRLAVWAGASGCENKERNQHFPAEVRRCHAASPGIRRLGPTCSSRRSFVPAQPGSGRSGVESQAPLVLQSSHSFCHDPSQDPWAPASYVQAERSMTEMQAH